MHTQAVTKSLDNLLSLCGVPGIIYSDRGSGFVAREFETYIMKRGIASTHSSVCHLTGNAQVGQLNGVILTRCKTIAEV